MIEKGEIIFWENGNKEILKYRRTKRILWSIIGIIILIIAIMIFIDTQLKSIFYIFGFLTAIIFGSLILIHIAGFTDLKVYENGISMPFRLIISILKNEEYFIPFSKIEKVKIRKYVVELIINDMITWNQINNKDISDIDKFIKVIRNKTKIIKIDD